MGATDREARVVVEVASSARPGVVGLLEHAGQPHVGLVAAAVGEPETDEAVSVDVDEFVLLRDPATVVRYSPVGIRLPGSGRRTWRNRHASRA
ncbi:hypothetical protein [Nannocystis pusilla]|uniref:hypothetical protein n=1 Tax=Nannocystis pusilla TaxID=889268 RepID=UPI003BF06789